MINHIVRTTACDVLDGEISVGNGRDTREKTNHTTFGIRPAYTYRTLKRVIYYPGKKLRFLLVSLLAIRSIKAVNN